MVADFVPPCACAADIGTDHGYLPVWLLQNGVVQTAIAADIHVGPLANARKSAAAYDLEERVRFVQADGLQFPDAQAADVITIAGMGGETICAILTATPWLRQGKRLVLQPQSKVQELTDWLWHNGFTIEDAALCRDAGKRYLALRVLGQPAGQTYTVERLLLRRRDPLLPEHLTEEIRRQTRARAGMALAKQTPAAEGGTDMVIINDIYAFLNEIAPVRYQMDFDNAGFLVGDGGTAVKNALLALDITDAVIAEAIELRAQLIVSHHPLIFTPLRHATTDDLAGRKVLTMARHGISAICMHTNLDIADGGVNDALMAALGAEVTGGLEPAGTAADGRTLTCGRVGKLPNPMTMAEFLPYVAGRLHVNGLRYVDGGLPVERIAVCGGSGGNMLDLAAAKGCDTFVTADVKYNRFLAAKELGINLIDADHFCTENVVIPVLQEKLQRQFPDVTFTVSQVLHQTAQTYCP